MGRNVKLIILCEDTQHEAFICRFFKKHGWTHRDIHVVKSPSGRGAGEQFVRERFPKELRAYRSHKYVAQALLVMLDGDSVGVDARLRALDDSCRLQGVDPRRDDDRVAVFIPTWCIETWFAYLDGDNVDETRSDYPKLARERDCQKFVRLLFKMCQSGNLRAPEPQSLRTACREYEKRLRQGSLA